MLSEDSDNFIANEDYDNDYSDNSNNEKPNILNGKGKRKLSKQLIEDIEVE